MENENLETKNATNQIIVQTSPPNFLTRRHLVKNNQIKIIGQLECLKYISHIEMSICYGGKLFSCLVDLEDYDFLKDFSWCAKKQEKAMYTHTRMLKNGRSCMVLMHRFILEKHHKELSKMDVDHINRNTLDNRKQNLRICTRAQNRGNSSRDEERSKSGYRGVCMSSNYKKWQSQIVVNGKHHWIGTFSSKVEAALAWNKRAKELLGEFAYQNVI